MTVAMLERAAAMATRVGLVPKLKLLLAYYQVILVMPEVYSVPLPPEYFMVMHHFEWISFDLTSIGIPASTCIGSFHKRLLLSSLLPLVALGMLTGGAIGSGLLQARPSTARAVLAQVRCGLLLSMPVVLPLLFALVPYISSRIFSTFSCSECERTSGTPGTASQPLALPLTPPPHFARRHLFSL